MQTLADALWPHDAREIGCSKCLHKLPPRRELWNYLHDVDKRTAMETGQKLPIAIDNT